MKKFITITIVFSILLVTLGVSGSVGAQREEMGPDEVIQAIYGAIAAKDIDAAMEFVADDIVAVFKPPPPEHDGVITGRDEMQAWFEGLIAEGARADFFDIEVSGNRATWKAKWWDAFFEPLGLVPAEFEGTNIVQDGLLIQHTWVFTEEFLAQFDAVMELEANKEIVRRYMKAWEQADVEVLTEVLAEDFVNHSPPMPPPREGMIAFAVESRSSFTTGEYSIDRLAAEDDWVSVYGRFQGVHNGEPYAGILASGVEVAFDYSIFLRLENGKIVERWGTSDSIMGMLVPLGFELVPPGVAPPVDAHETIAAANEAFMGLFNEGDAAGLAGLYTEDGQMMPPNGEILQGREALTVFWQSLFDAGFKAVELEIVEAEGIGEIITEVSTYTLFGGDGAVLDRGKYIILWKQVDGQWMIHRDIFNSSIPLQ